MVTVLWTRNICRYVYNMFGDSEWSDVDTNVQIVMYKHEKKITYEKTKYNDTSMTLQWKRDNSFILYAVIG